MVWGALQLMGMDVKRQHLPLPLASKGEEVFKISEGHEQAGSAALLFATSLHTCFQVFLK